MEHTIRRYSIAYKQAIVADVESGRYTVLEIARLHQIGFPTVYKWMKRFGGPDTQTRIVRIEMPEERKRLKELERDKQALEKALAQAQVKIMTLEATLEVLEERTGQRVKKKTDTPSSPESDNGVGN